jgi:hypothetical protein
MQAFDVIVEFNGKPVQRSDDLPQLVWQPHRARGAGRSSTAERTLNVKVERLILD